MEDRSLSTNNMRLCTLPPLNAILDASRMTVCPLKDVAEMIGDTLRMPRRSSRRVQEVFLRVLPTIQFKPVVSEPGWSNLPKHKHKQRPRFCGSAQAAASLLQVSLLCRRPVPVLRAGLYMFGMCGLTCTGVRLPVSDATQAVNSVRYPLLHLS